MSAGRSRAQALTVSLAVFVSPVHPVGTSVLPLTVRPRRAQSPAYVTLMQFSHTTFIRGRSESATASSTNPSSPGDVSATFSGEDRENGLSAGARRAFRGPVGTFERMIRIAAAPHVQAMQAELLEFQRADANGDGVLSVSEVMRFNAAQHGGSSRADAPEGPDRIPCPCCCAFCAPVAVAAVAPAVPAFGTLGGAAARRRARLHGRQRQGPDRGDCRRCGSRRRCGQ